MDTLDLGYGIQLPLSELQFGFARSGGPGGQHVNRSETKVELRWDVANSPSLSEAQRATLLGTLTTYLTDDGVLLLTSDESRSQHRNRELVVERLQTLVREALRPRRARRATKPSAGARATRLQRKKERGEKKARRARIDPGDY